MKNTQNLHVQEGGDEADIQQLEQAKDSQKYWWKLEDHVAKFNQSLHLWEFDWMVSIIAIVAAEPSAVIYKGFQSRSTDF